MRRSRPFPLSAPVEPLEAAAIVVLSLLLLLFAMPAFAGRARESIHPVVQLVPVQQPLCAAPCAAYLDTLGTSADGVAQPFEHLLYETWCDGVPDLPLPRSRCVFEQPGKHSASVRITRSDTGESVFRTVSLDVAPRSAVAQVKLQAGQRYRTVAFPPGPGVLSAEGVGPPPVVFGGLSMPSNWTVVGVDVEVGMIAIPPGVSGVFLLRVHGSELTDGGVVSMTGGGSVHSDRIAVVDSTFRSAPAFVMTLLYFRAERLILTGVVAEGGGSYNLRTVHWPGAVIAENRIESLAPHANCAQLRGWGGTGPPNVASSYSVFFGNECVVTSPGTAVVRTCWTNTCDDTGPGVRTAVEISHVLFRSNLFRVVGAEAPPPSVAFWVAGSFLVFEDNEVRCLRCNMGTPGTARLVQQLQPSALVPGLSQSWLEVRRTLATFPAGVRAVVPCDLPFGSGHECDPVSNVILRSVAGGS